MKLKDLVSNLKSLKEKGFIRSERKGPTGIGHLAEKELELKESNIAIPDIGGRIEVKTTRKNANSLITLFTFNRGVWKIKQKDVVLKYGYVDVHGRHSLYTTVNISPNALGFYLVSDLSKNLIILRNTNEQENIAEWSIYVIAGKFMTKMDRLLLIMADSYFENDTEFFHFNEAYLLEKPTVEKFLEAFNENKLMIDIRMHLKKNNGVRNHGTAFRIAEKHLKDLYAKQSKLI